MSQSALPALSPLFTGRWEAVVAELSRTIDLEATARQHKAIQRVKKLRSAEDLLCLAMIWGPGRQSYRETAALAAHGKIVDMSDKGIVGRMRKAGDWLAHILANLLAARTNRPRADALDVSVIDGSVICSPGKGEDWRLHARYDAGQGRFSDLVLTTTRQAECASRTPAQARQITIMDRGYARVRSFQAVLRSVLRQDPDVVLVGETRDAETARIATQAALTGHLVLTTLHTSNALQASTRLIDMGVERYMLAPSLLGVLNQRLVRRLCEICKTDYQPNPEYLRQFFRWNKDFNLPPLYRGEGCEHCEKTGFHGRIGIHEFLQVTPKLRDALMRGAGYDELRDIAVKEGFKEMRYDGLKKALRGLTTIDEVIKSTTTEFE